MHLKFKKKCHVVLFSLGSEKVQYIYTRIAKVQGTFVCTVRSYHLKCHCGVTDTFDALVGITGNTHT